MHKYDDFTAKDVNRTYTNIGVRIQDESERVTIDGGTWRDAGSPDSIGAAFSLVAGSMTIRNVTAIGNYLTSVKPKAAFPNRDGIMAAQRTFLTINGGTFKRFWDAGIDTKATTTMTGTVTVEDSRVSLKVWGPLVGDTLVSRNARDGDVAALQSPVVTGNIHLRKLVVWNEDPNGLLVGFQGDGGIVRIDECELHVPPSYRVSWIKPGSKNTKLILGPTCVQGGKVVVAPIKATAPTGQLVDAGQLLPDGSKDGLITLGAKWAAKLKLKTNTVVRHWDGFRYEVVP
ncbi:hypothetical protein NHF48_007260 [Sphingomonas sp. H160509]|uniref:hypothetical protein n=1 Tax=Sphingomonas sp. H160509 TaxID=2955313 RepID=UPI002097B5D4|nr:hypothetical protein [Sphingomonas sp. H160509]MDD1450799.1 hypothetical protein [Sphingomonas sp. H160509]